MKLSSAGLLQDGIEKSDHKLLLFAGQKPNLLPDLGI
jgi:hypothetical protein